MRLWIPSFKTAIDNLNDSQRRTQTVEVLGSTPREAWLKKLGLHLAQTRGDSVG